MEQLQERDKQRTRIHGDCKEQHLTTFFGLGLPSSDAMSVHHAGAPGDRSKDP